MYLLNTKKSENWVICEKLPINIPPDSAKHNIYFMLD